METYDQNGNLYAKTINKWESTAVSGSDAKFVKLSQSVESAYNGDTSHKDKAEAYAYDTATGNQTQKT